MRRLIAIGIVLAVAACQTVTPPPASLQVVSAEFGVFTAGADGQVAFTASKSVPLVVDQLYGWIIVLKTAQARVKWREEFTLPAAPATWGKQEGSTQTLSADRRVSVTEREVEPVRGIIYNSWSVVQGDPKGAYTIRVTVEGAEPVVFRFTVE